MERGVSSFGFPFPLFLLLVLVKDAKQKDGVVVDTPKKYFFVLV